jgi:hypothetical protein
VFFEAQTAAAIAAAVERFEREAGAIDPDDCRANALAFTPERFRSAYRAEIAQAWALHGGRVVQDSDAA